MTTDLNKLRWRCRRGTLELDVIFQRFLEQQYQQLSALQQQAFVELLALEDDQLIRYLNEDQLPENPAHKELVVKMRSITSNQTGEVDDQIQPG